MCFVVASNGECVPQGFNCLVSVMDKPCVFCEEPTVCVLFTWNAFLKGLNDERTQVRISVNCTYYVVLLSISSPGLGEYFSCATTSSFRILSFSSLTNSRPSELLAATDAVHKMEALLYILHNNCVKWTQNGEVLAVHGALCRQHYGINVQLVVICRIVCIEGLQ